MDSLIIPILVTLAGGIGAILRFVISGWSGVLPWGILVANIAGSFLLGAFVVGSDPGLWVVISALAGGLSTFSSFAAQTSVFITKTQRMRAFWNILLNLVLPILAVWLGAAIDALVK